MSAQNLGKILSLGAHRVGTERRLPSSSQQSREDVRE